MNNKLTVPLAIVLGGIIVAGAVYISTPKKSPAGPDNIDASLVRPVGADDHILGNPSAKVMIVEYSDFDCDYCKAFNDTLHRIITDAGAGGDVAWVFREFPLIEIHPNAMSNAEAAECAAQVGGNATFWKFSDALFAHQPVDPSQYGTFAASIGILSNDFATCFQNASTTVAARIMADRQNALAMGAQGTPISIILVAGKPPIVMSGGYPYEAAVELVKQALQSTR